MTVLTDEERAEQFAKIVAKTGKVWAHPDTLQKWLKVPGVEEMLRVEGIEPVGNEWLRPGELYAIDIATNPLRDLINPKWDTWWRNDSGAMHHIVVGELKDKP